jgi:hypothetical protein
VTASVSEGRRTGPGRSNLTCPAAIGCCAAALSASDRLIAWDPRRVTRVAGISRPAPRGGAHPMGEFPSQEGRGRWAVLLLGDNEMRLMHSMQPSVRFAPRCGTVRCLSLCLSPPHAHWRQIARRVIGQTLTKVSADRSRQCRQIAHVLVRLR